jgi:hypothetical protein
VSTVQFTPDVDQAFQSRACVVRFCESNLDIERWPDRVLWDEERIANELLLKLGERISPRTVRKYLPKRPLGRPRGDRRWSTFLRNQATAIRPSSHATSSAYIRSGCFPFRGQRIDSMNNTGWQNAPRPWAGANAGSRPAPHRSPAACALPACQPRDRAALLGHAEHSMSQHYASADVDRLLKLANLVPHRAETRTVLRVANG